MNSASFEAKYHTITDELFVQSRLDDDDPQSSCVQPSFGDVYDLVRVWVHSKTYIGLHEITSNRFSTSIQSNLQIAHGPPGIYDDAR